MKDMSISSDIARLDALIRDSSKIGIVVHTHPDGDAVGSSVALWNYLHLRKGSPDETLVRVFLPDLAPSYLDFVFGNADVAVASENLSSAKEFLLDCDAVFCLDMNDFSRAAALEEVLENSTARKVLIDHHLNPAKDKFELVFSETCVSSTCEELFLLLCKMRDIPGPREIPLNVALPLLVGMTTDTNNFANSVFPSTLNMASDLLACGVDRDAVLSHLYNEYRENRFRAMGYVLSRLLHIAPSGVAYVVLDAKTKEKFSLIDGETEGFVNIPLGIKEVKMSIFVREEDGVFRVSVRSKKGYSAARFASEYFNGGGHENAAGGKLRIPEDVISAEDVEKYIIGSAARFVY